MPSATRSASSTQAPACLLAAVAIVIAAQLVSGVPLAAAVSLAAWGTALAVGRRRGLLFAAVAVYAPLCVWAVAAEVDLAMRSPSLAWGWLVAFDGAACVTLIFSLVRQTGQLLAAARD
jgi:hypothetical protein